ncbi:phage capsid protein [Epibacterium sp. MM17-32]|uniref:phage capsid protein n=1 Tax=Epibacterium sp. MM17-32 TaxID=2917734 RepID=UPI001EF50506|nr:phage capsid protein [Epibacterium sp. MM17-32]MCG7628389.1 phage capsid protein [Epibacterium sp. MM17-32]
MADAIISQLGVVNAATPADQTEANALFMKQFTGEVLTAFNEMNVFMPMHQVRTISQGKSASFNHTGKANARYHTAGTPILGDNKVKHNETIIKIDDKLISDVFIDDLEEAKNHYDVRSEYSKQLGAALSREFDQKVARVIALAARSSNKIDDLPGGSRLTHADAKTDGTVLSNLLFTAAQTFDEKDVWEGERYATFKPAQYYLLVQNKDNLNRDWGGNGSYASATLPQVAGIEIHKSNNIPSGVVTSASGERNDYSGDFSTTAGLVFQKAAAGTVKLMDLAMQKSGSDFEIMYQGTLMVGKYAMGHGVLRPECSIELATGPVA